MSIFTVGHSTRSLDDLVEILIEAKIDLLIDVRSYPGSRRYPHFGKETLAVSIPEHGIDYLHIPELGGRRKASKSSRHTALRVAAFQAYADWMETPDFTQGLAKLEELGHKMRVAYMCSECVWWKCHRRMLSDILTARGWIVRHLGLGKETVHELWNVARHKDGKLIYDQASGGTK